MAPWTGVALAVAAALFAAACFSPQDTRSVLPEATVPAAVEAAATPPPPGEEFADTPRDVVLTAPSEWPAHEDFEMAVGGYLVHSFAEQVDALPRYRQYAAAFAASECAEGRRPTPEGFQAFVGRVITAGRDTGAVLAEATESAVSSLGAKGALG